MPPLRIPTRALRPSLPKVLNRRGNSTTATPAIPQWTTQQAPNRVATWTTSQQPRARAMTGPRFEQTDFAAQPAPHSAMELIHEVPVTWVHTKTVVCQGTAGSSGHPRIFINTDKPQVCVCGYCGTPFANEHHRAHIEAQPEQAYPLA